MDQNNAPVSTNPVSVSPVSVVSADSKWEIEVLVKQAFARTKERFLSYFLIGVLTYVVFIVLMLAGVLGGVVVGVLVAAKVLVVAVVLGMLLGVAFFLLMFYIGSWMSLGAVNIIISKEKMGISASLRYVKPMVWGYIWLNAVVLLFTLGLLPFGLITFFIIPLLWSVWGMFTGFVYLEYQKKGLANLWMSKALVGQKFWGILGRAVLIIVSIWLIQIALVYGGRAAGMSGVSGIVSFLVSLFTGPFVISFLYEMYANTDKNVAVKSPVGWVVVSVIGYVLIVAFTVVVGAAIGQAAAGVLNAIEKNPKALENMRVPGQTQQELNGSQNPGGQMMEQYLQGVQKGNGMMYPQGISGTPGAY